MRRWRKMTWTILIWTFLFLVWGISGASAVSNSCVGRTGDDLSICQAGTAIGGGIGLTLIFGLWFVGFIVLALVWFMSRPKENVTVYGPDGQGVVVSEKEATRRVRAGWTYQPRG